MFLKKIELYGFKSFSKRKEIFLKGGITGIVGPNGSGKSNIADALRWVLGEQSSKALRGSTMRDVIFNGTQTKPQKGFCEVSLTFDNTENLLKSEYSEICVKRKMYRSGESEYSINNNSCRLKDILDLFRDTGIGKEGYSIIGQGKINEILDNKPINRRRIFEEAAGISKFRVRKEEAENNLQKTHSNLIRIEDILSELALQLEPLEKQMHDAKHYIAITEKLKVLETNICLHLYDDAYQKNEADKDNILIYEQQIKETEENIAISTDCITQIKKDLDIIQLDLDKKNLELSGALQEYEKLKGERTLVEERIGFIQKSEQEITDKTVSLNESIKEQIEAKEQCANSIELIENKINDLNSKLKIIIEKDDNFKLTSELVVLLEKNEKLSDELKEKINSYEMIINEKNVEADFLKEKINDFEQKINEKQVLLETEKNNAKNAEQSICEISNNGDMLQDELEKIKQNLRNSQKAKDEISEKLNIARREFDKTVSQIDMLKNITDKHEGYFDSVKRLLNKAESYKPIKNIIVGTVVDLIHVPTQYETAIEVSLGNAMQNIIVKSDSDAKRIIEFLRNNNIGRITFLPIENLKIRTISEKEQRLIALSDVLGVASDLIDCDSKARKAVEFLLGRTVITKDLESALKFAKNSGYSLKTVTLKGEIISPGGPVTGGCIRKNNVDLISRGRISEELTNKKEELKETINLYNNELISYRQDEIDLTNKKEEKESQITKFQLDTVAVRQQYISFDANIERLETEIEEIKRELNEINNDYLQLNKVINDKTNELEELKKNFANISIEIEELNNRLNSAQNKTDQFKNEVDSFNEKILDLNHQKEIKELEFEHLNNTVSSMEFTLNEYKEQINNLAIEAQSQKIIYEKVLDSIIDIEKNTEISNEEVRALSEYKQIKRNDLEEVEKREKDLNLLLNDLNEKKYKLVSSVEKSKNVMENAQRKLWDTYSLTYANALKLKSDEFVYVNAQKECDKIKSEMRDIGSVNPNAIEDYNRVRERYDNINAQKEDLIKAAEDLQIVIDDLLNNMAHCFKEKFEQIDKSFQKVFSELFGGGTAALNLQDDNNIMECGIDIAAEPPGKKLQSISLMSGGEKALTAIALLFAMLKINPSPVCLLDEIDAPLDDANLIRFSEYLKRISNENQFIVITHRKPTMSACDTLYGVAMHEKGISDMVSVKISG